MTARTGSLYMLLFRVLEKRGGLVVFAPMRLRLAANRYREPDLMLLLNQADVRRGASHWTGADLVIEVLSADDPDRDLVRKRAEYARAGVPEYWIVFPEDKAILVLTLDPERSGYSCTTNYCNANRSNFST
ncbi:MAG: Uma2 family endonuclease [Spirochaetales bacterium]|nr:Uma2 family endonuclease [Spirochaetales bacterium]